MYEAICQFYNSMTNRQSAMDFYINISSGVYSWNQSDPIELFKEHSYLFVGWRMVKVFGDNCPEDIIVAEEFLGWVDVQ